MNLVRILPKVHYQYVPGNSPLGIEVIVLLVSRVVVSDLDQVSVLVVFEDLRAETRVLVEVVDAVRELVSAHRHRTSVLILVVCHLSITLSHLGKGPGKRDIPEVISFNAFRQCKRLF